MHYMLEQNIKVLNVLYICYNYILPYIPSYHMKGNLIWFLELNIAGFTESQNDFVL